jgi:hypothetical protein
MAFSNPPYLLNMHKIYTILGLSWGLGLLPLAGRAQTQTPTTITPVDVTGFGSANTYTQNFNTLFRTSGSTSNALPAGWGFAETGDLANGTYAVSTGSTGVGDTYSFGASTSVNGAADRALGAVQNTSAGTSLAATLGVAFRNQTGSPIDGFTIQYQGEQWRNGNSARADADRLDFQYVTTTGTPAASLISGTYTTVAALSFSSPKYNTAPAPGAAVTLDGNAAGNFQTVSAFLPVHLDAGATIYLRWVDFDVSGNDDGLGIDDFQITAVQLPTVTTDAPAVTTLSTTVGGNVSSAGTNGPVSGRGVVYSATNIMPTLGGADVTAVAVGSGLGAFSTALTGLTHFTTYYMAAYATNANGTSYGPVETFVSAAGATSLTALNVAYAENFNTLASTGGTNAKATLPTGWDFVEVVPASGSGSSAPDNTYSTAASNTGNTYSLGTTGTADRAFGMVQNSGVQSTIGAAFVNNTGQTITSIRISYTGEMWRAGGSALTDRLEFEYSTSATAFTAGTFTAVPALNFASPTSPATNTALDGNDAANRAARTAAIAVSIAPGGSLFIRWNDINVAGTDDALGVEDFSLTASTTPLPVELVDFTAIMTGSGTAQLAWHTASERNSAYFAIERSTDGRTFETLDQVPAQGNSTSPTAYSWRDANQAAGTVLYYRLRQVDKDGTTSYSPVRAVQAGPATARPVRFEVYPTVIEQGLLHYSGQGFAPAASIELYSFTGQLVKRQSAVNETRVIPVAGLPTGWYLARLLTTGEQKQVRFFVP